MVGALPGEQSNVRVKRHDESKMKGHSTVRDLKESPDPDRRVRFNDLLGGVDVVPSAPFIASQLRILADRLETGKFRPLRFKDELTLRRAPRLAPSLIELQLFYVNSEFV